MTLDMNEVLFEDWGASGLPEPGPAKLYIEKAEVRQYSGTNGPFEKLVLQTTITEREPGVEVQPFPWTFSLSMDFNVRRNADKIRNLFTGAEVRPPNKKVSREDLYNMVKSLEGRSVWAIIDHYQDSQGTIRASFGFRFATDYEGLRRRN